MSRPRVCRRRPESRSSESVTVPRFVTAPSFPEWSSPGGRTRGRAHRSGEPWLRGRRSEPSLARGYSLRTHLVGVRLAGGAPSPSRYVPPNPTALGMGLCPGAELCLPPAGMGHVSLGLVDRGRLEANAKTSQYHVAVVKQTTVRLPDDLADDARAVARLQGTNPN